MLVEPPGCRDMRQNPVGEPAATAAWNFDTHKTARFFETACAASGANRSRPSIQCQAQARHARFHLYPGEREKHSRCPGLPMAGRQVRLVLLARRFCCGAVLCGHAFSTAVRRRRIGAMGAANREPRYDARDIRQGNGCRPNGRSARSARRPRRAGWERRSPTHAAMPFSPSLALRAETTSTRPISPKAERRTQPTKSAPLTKKA